MYELFEPKNISQTLALGEITPSPFAPAHLSTMVSRDIQGRNTIYQGLEVPISGLGHQYSYGEGVETRQSIPI